MGKVWLGLGFLFSIATFIASPEVFELVGSYNSRTASWVDRGRELSVPVSYEYCYTEYDARLEKAAITNKTLLLIKRIRDPFIDRPEAGLKNCIAQEDSRQATNVEFWESQAPGSVFNDDLFWPTVGWLLSIGASVTCFILYRKSLTQDL